jgi:hypothetical protein
LSSGFIVRRDPERGSGEYPYWLNRKDCLDDDLSLADPGAGKGQQERSVIQITPTLKGFNTTMNLEVWVGTTADCTDQAERRTATGRCWQVYSKVPTQSGATIEIRPRQVIAQKNEDWESVKTCDLGTDRIAITMYVMLLKGGTNGDVLGTAATWDKTTIDIAAPQPPQDVVVDSGDARLFPEWTVPISNDLEDTQGFRFYCEELNGAATGGAGQGGSTSTGTTGQGGNGGAAPSNVGCATTPQRLVAGQHVDGLEAMRCGFVTGRSSRDGQAAYFLDPDTNQPTRPLENGKTYAIGITTGDLVFNESKLSQVACGTPKEVTTFFEAYRNAGGKGGGGICSYGPSAPSSFGWLACGAGLLGSVALLRRRGRGA